MKIDLDLPWEVIDHITVTSLKRYKEHLESMLAERLLVTEEDIKNSKKDIKAINRIIKLFGD